MSMIENRTAPLATAAIVALVGLWLAPNSGSASKAASRAAAERTAKVEYNERIEQAKADHVQALALCDTKRSMDWQVCVMQVDAQYTQSAAQAERDYSARIAQSADSPALPAERTSHVNS